MTGTGITPMLQVIEELLDQAEDTTTMTLLYCSQNPEEIILKDYIDELAALWPDRLTVHYVIDKPVPGWSGKTGYITPAMLETTMPSAAEVCSLPRNRACLSFGDA